MENHPQLADKRRIGCLCTVKLSTCRSTDDLTNSPIPVELSAWPRIACHRGRISPRRSISR
jgi:hypothetical protein